MPHLHEDAFETRYRSMNSNQRQAVDTIYGPVMVIAGPGTGKTEVLSMRIANLLRSEAQVQPADIICLTYTDEATNAMRRRLLDIAGDAAHKVMICTFHAFCNTIIQNHSELFGIRNLQPITDLEKTELLYELLDELPQGHTLRKLSGNIYFDAARLSRLFDMMKREALTTEAVVLSIEAEIQSLPQQEKYSYKRNGKGYKKGEPKQALIDDEVKKLEAAKAAAALYPVFTRKMTERGRYDFSDMLIWVLQAFKENAALLQSYQERYQYILVDEFQDTNGAQCELLKMLADYWEDPNIFVVGDDDQSIYEFQGARIRNIIEFYERYEETIRVIILPQNYRSSQAILDKAMAAISNNNERLIYRLEALGLDKNIVSSHPRFTKEEEVIRPIICSYTNVLQEEAAVVMQIEKLLQNGTVASDIAILYAQHRQVDGMLELMDRKGIPYFVKRPVNVLAQPVVQGILLLMRYLQMERHQAFSGEGMLYEILHAPWFRVPPSDIALLSLQMQAGAVRKDSWSKWRLLLNNYLLLESAGTKSAQTLYRIGGSIDGWLQHISSLPLQLLVEKIMYESGMMEYVLSMPDKAWQTQVLYSFFSFVKDASARNTRLKLPDFLALIEKMNDEEIALPLQQLLQPEDAVYCSTAHGAKGSEYEHVFLIGCTKNFWEERRGTTNDFKLPELITGNADDKDRQHRTETARRLFYVALTRAKKHLYISYAQKDSAGKNLEPTRFIDEISTAAERCDYTVPDADLLAAMHWAMKPVPQVRIQLAHQKYIERILASMAMSYTNLSKYIRCPLAFYFECILKVPFQRSDALAFGSAIHDTLERLYREMQQRQGIFPSIEEVVKYFDSYLYRERNSFTTAQYERRQEQGHNLLRDYYAAYLYQFEHEVEVEYKVPRYNLDGIPITGKIDKIVLHKDGCTVVDYKTGNPDKSIGALTQRPTEANPNGGDYWRQMVFYRLLLRHQPGQRWNINRGVFDYVEKSRTTRRYKQVEIPTLPDDEEIVRKQLKGSWMRIQNHEFDTGCGKEDCHWCNFARRYEMIRPAADTTVEIDDL